MFKPLHIQPELPCVVLLGRQLELKVVYAAQPVSPSQIMTINSLIQPCNLKFGIYINIGYIVDSIIDSRFAHLVSFQISDSPWNETTNIYLRRNPSLKNENSMAPVRRCENGPWRLRVLQSKRTTLKCFDLTCQHATEPNLSKKKKRSHHCAVSWFRGWTRPLSLGSSCCATTVTEVDEWTVSSLRGTTELFDLFLMAFFTATS